MPTLGLTQTAKDGRDTQGVTPVYRPMLNGETLDITVSKLTMALGENKHDQATIEATSTTLTTTDGLAGSAISFFFGLSPRTELWCGYIEKVTEESSNTSGLLTFTMSCLGTTKEMQGGLPRQWINNTIPQVVEKIAYNGLLGYHGHIHPYVWPMLAQTDDSDWRVVTVLAQRLGWSIFNRYGVVMCYDTTKLIRDGGSFISLISSQYAATAFQDYERALVEFNPNEDSDASYRQIGTKVSYINNDTVQTVTQTGDKYTVFKYLNITARGQEEADIWANRQAFVTASWNQQATARVLGNAQIYPGMGVDVYTRDPNWSTKNKYNGRWLVREVAHSADRQTFQTQLALARPGGATPVSETPYVPFWQEPNNVLTSDDRLRIGDQLTKSKPSLTLYDKRWRSSWLMQVMI